MSHSKEGSLRAVLYALCANGGIAVSKFVAAAYTGSGAMLAEAFHSTADCANQVLLLLGMKQAEKPESEDHPLGHHRVVYFFSMLVALLLFGMGSVFSIYEGVHRLGNTEPLASPHIAMVVLGLAVVLEGFSLAGALRETRKIAGNKPLLRWFRESRESELMVVVGEDVAALLGLVVAFVAVAATVLTGNPVYDAIGSIAVGVILGVISIAVLLEVKSLIVGESASPELRKEITDFVTDQPEIKQVFRIITLAWGDKLVIAVKAEMEQFPDQLSLIHAINAVEERIQQKWPAAKWVFFEPDIR